jgi:transposase
VSLKKYIVKLSAEERKELIGITKKGRHAASKILHARILLAADVGEFGSEELGDVQIAKLLGIGFQTVARARHRLVEEGFEAALTRKPRVVKKPKIITGDEEAHLIAMCCSPAPAGRAKWTLKLLANHMIEKEIVGTISPATVGRALKKTNLSLGKR